VEEKGLHFIDTHVFGVTLAMEQGVLNPLHAGLLGAVGVVLEVNAMRDLFKEYFAFGEFYILSCMCGNVQLFRRILT